MWLVEQSGAKLGYYLYYVMQVSYWLNAWWRIVDFGNHGAMVVVL